MTPAEAARIQHVVTVLRAWCEVTERDGVAEHVRALCDAYDADAERRDAEQAVIDAADKLERHPLANEYAVGWVAFADLLACVRICRDCGVCRPNGRRHR